MMPEMFTYWVKSFIYFSNNNTFAQIWCTSSICARRRICMPPEFWWQLRTLELHIYSWAWPYPCRLIGQSLRAVWVRTICWLKIRVLYEQALRAADFFKYSYIVTRVALKGASGNVLFYSWGITLSWCHCQPTCWLVDLLIVQSFTLF